MIIRVFPRRNKWTPDDAMAFVGDPPLFRPEASKVLVSCVFTWDIPEALRLKRAWGKYYNNVIVGGPAFNDDGGESFVPGMFIKLGVTITSRGCPYSCFWCFVPIREGNIREMQHIVPGNIIQDNNLLACSKEHIRKVVDMLRSQKNIQFKGGLDKKLFRKENNEMFKDLNISEYWFSCDDDNGWKELEYVANTLSSVSTNKKRCYCLIGYSGDSPDNAEKRLKRVYALGFLPFAQLYRPIDSSQTHHTSRIWRDLARKWSRPAIYRSHNTVQAPEWGE